MSTRSSYDNDYEDIDNSYEDDDDYDAYDDDEEKGGSIDSEEETNVKKFNLALAFDDDCLLYTSPSPRDRQKSRMPSSA